MTYLNERFTSIYNFISDNDTSVTKLARHYWGEVKFLCALAKQLIDQKNYCFDISILVGIFFMPNSMILIASARLNFSTALSPLLSSFTVHKLILIPDAIALAVDFSRISLIIFMSAIPCFRLKFPLF